VEGELQEGEYRRRPRCVPRSVVLSGKGRFRTHPEFAHNCGAVESYIGGVFMRSTYRFFALMLLIGALAGSPAYGQGGATGAISGSVVDTSGGSGAGADMQIIDTRTGVVVRRLPKGADGSFVVILVPA